MHYVILTFLVLLLAYAALRAFLNANPKTLVSTVRKIGGVALLVMAVFFAATGRFGAAAPLAFFALTLLARGLVPGGFNPFPGNAQKSSDQKSRVRTGMVEMELDHDTGDMDGQIISGTFAGRRLSSLGENELLILLDECGKSDMQALQLMEAYMDRRFPDWRDRDAGGDARAQGKGRASSGGRMTIDEAFEILGLDRDATKSDIRKAHRTLMKKLHPDQGGSTYLAAKINEAKDLLLGTG